MFSKRINSIMILLFSVVFLSFYFGEARKEYHRRHIQDGLPCYNCLSYEHEGCWDPKHPDNWNKTIPHVDCYVENEDFSCLIITAEKALLVDSKRSIGPVKVRTCIAVKEFKNQEVSYTKCDKISKELTESDVFSRIQVSRPKCQLCNEPLCSL